MSRRRRVFKAGGSDSGDDSDAISAESESSDERSLGEIENAAAAMPVAPTATKVDKETKKIIRSSDKKGRRSKGTAESTSKESGTEKERKKAPTFVPRGGQFFLHDNRQHSNRSNNKSIMDSNGRSEEISWKHDMFDVHDEGHSKEVQIVSKKRNNKTNHKKKNKTATRSNDMMTEGEDIANKDAKGGKVDIKKEMNRKGSHRQKPSTEGTDKSEKKPSEKTSDSTPKISVEEEENRDQKNGKLSIKLKATAPAFTPTSPSKPLVEVDTAVPSATVAQSDASSPTYQTSQKRYGGHGQSYEPYANSNYPGQTEQFNRSSRRSRRYPDIKTESAPYAQSEYADAGVMYNYAGDSYYPDSYSNLYPVESPGAVDASGAVIFGAGTPGSRGKNGTVYFPTAPTSSTMPASPTIFNGTQYFPAPAAPVYYDQPPPVSTGIPSGGSHKENNYRDRYGVGR